MKLKTIFYFIFFGLVGCANPMKSLEPDIKEFKAQHPGQIQTFQGKYRKIQMAWSGDVHQRPIIFVHGSPGSWEAWVRFLQNSDLQKNYHLIAVDRPGYGGSGAGQTEVSLAKQADDIISVLAFNQSGKPAILVGHSYGGPVVVKMAMEHSKEVAAVVVVAGSVSPDLEKTKWFQIPGQWWPIRNLIPNMLRVCNEEILPLKGELNQMLPDWPNIKAKMALVQGEEDDLVPPGNLDFMLKKLNSESVVKVVRAPHVNHFIPWQHPEFILESIRAVNQAIN